MGRVRILSLPYCTDTVTYTRTTTTGTVLVEYSLPLSIDKWNKI